MPLVPLLALLLLVGPPTNQDEHFGLHNHVDGAFGERVGGLTPVISAGPDLGVFSQYETPRVSIAVYNTADFARPIRRNGGTALQLTLITPDGNHHSATADAVEADTEEMIRSLGRATSTLLDIRKQFGLPDELPPGDYRLGAMYDPGSFDTTPESPLILPVVHFHIEHVTLEEAQAKNKAAHEGPVRLTLDAEPPALGTRTGTLTNEAEEPILFTAYVSSDEVDPRAGRPILAGDRVYQVLNSGDLFRPDGWKEMPPRWCGTGAGPVRLEPGQSCSVQLSSYWESGLVRFRVRYRSMGEDGPSGSATSEVILLSPGR